RLKRLRCAKPIEGSADVQEEVEIEAAARLGRGRLGFGGCHAGRSTCPCSPAMGRKSHRASESRGQQGGSARRTRRTLWLRRRVPHRLSLSTGSVAPHP